jgi:hypothetical protein
MVGPGWDEQRDPTAAPPPTPPAYSAQAEAEQPAAPDERPHEAATEARPDVHPHPGPSPNGSVPNGSAPTAQPPTAYAPGPPQPAASAPGSTAPTATEPGGAVPAAAEPGAAVPGQAPPTVPAPGGPSSGAPMPGGSGVGGVSLPAYTGPYPASGEYPDIPPGWRRAGLPPSPWPVRRAEVVAGVATVLGLAVLGVLSAFVWLHVAPRLGFQITADGAAPLRPEEEQFFATDAWFVLLTLVWGLVAAAALWRVPRLRGPAAVVTLAVGGAVGAVVTWRLGLVFGPAPSKAAVETIGNVVYPPLKLRALSALVIEPLVGVGLYLLLAGFSGPDLGRGDAPPPYQAGYQAGGDWLPPAAD